jgi:hypothetical protein
LPTLRTLDNGIVSAFGAAVPQSALTETARRATILALAKKS